MSANSILDVVIGLVFVFFVCSLAVSGLNEFVRTLLSTRSKALWTSISRMLDESEDAPQSEALTVRLGTAPIRSAPMLSAAPVDGSDDTSLAARVYAHPIIGRLDPARLNRPSRINHIPATEFSRALVDILTPDDVEGNKQWDRLGERIDTLPRPLRSQFQLLYAESEGNVLRFRQAVESWFEHGMARVSAWYVQRTRVAMVGYGLLIAVAFNVSAIHLTTELYENDVVRDTVVQLASTEVQRDDIGACTDVSCVEDRVGEIVDTEIPVFWRRCQSGAGSDVCGFENWRAIVVTIAGWLITAAALSVGAAFWFALLKRAFQVRSALHAAPS